MSYEHEQVDESVGRSRLIQHLLWVGVFLLAFFAMPPEMSMEMQIAEVDSEIPPELVVDPPLEGSFVAVPTE